MKRDAKADLEMCELQMSYSFSAVVIGINYFLYAYTNSFK